MRLDDIDPTDNAQDLGSGGGGGGGGFGLPAERELASLAQDIRSGKSSRAQAERDYGPEMVTRALNLQG